MQTLPGKGLGMLKAVDGSFEVPTAETVTPFLLLSVGGSSCDFTLAPAQTPPHTIPLPYHLTHSTTLHLPILGPDISSTPPDTFPYMQQLACAHVPMLDIAPEYPSHNITLHTATHRWKQVFC